ncbi:alanine racemase [Alcaligenaceae bacterium CGII-47]|nr:alanine racemase [Alcaligenaceae bacterium CGII-47]
MPRPILAAISVAALSHNLNTVGQLLEQDVSIGIQRPSIWAVIKADAYGHGIDRALSGFALADGLAMLDLNEAVHCREAGWSGPLLLLEGFFEPEDIRVLDQYRISIVIHTNEQLDMLENSQVVHAVDACIKLNTGMNRLGFQQTEYSTAFARAQDLQNDGVLGLVGKMTHFACADDDPLATEAQLEVFNRVTDGLPGRVSVCNSAATLTPGFAAQVAPHAEQWVRPGICLYGASPFADRSAAQMGLRPAMTLRSELISVRTIAAGEQVGYGYRYTATRAMKIGVVACGYADGYPRHAPNGTPIVVDGVRTQLIGRVSMDMLAVDLTPVPAAHVGSPVILWGIDGPSVDEVAQACGTIGYELLCAVAPRVPRLSS